MTTIDIACRDVWREVSNYVDGDVSPELKVRMEAHFLTCTHCTAVLNGTRNVVRLIGDGMEFELPSGFRERLHERLKP
jgi:hypothetical protein